MRELTDLEKIECAEYVVDLLDSTKLGRGNEKNEHGTWMDRARATLRKRADQYLKVRSQTGTHL